MAIDRKPEWWVGDQPDDLREYLEAYAPEGYEVHEFRLSECTCGSNQFLLWADDNEGCAKRRCSSCGREHFICDSEDYWDDAAPDQWTCLECNATGNSCNIAIGFSLYPDGEIRWLYVGVRCSACGILGCFAGWKIAYSPSRHLLDQA